MVAARMRVSSPKAVNVIVVGGGYAGENGIGYLLKHGVQVDTVEGPQDPRLQAIA